MESGTAGSHGDREAEGLGKGRCNWFIEIICARGNMLIQTRYSSSLLILYRYTHLYLFMKYVNFCALCIFLPGVWLWEQGGHQREEWKHTLLLAFQSLGVVYGHLSISPLFVFETILYDKYNITSKDDLYGLLSLMFWTMTLIPLVKYILIVLNASDGGEGGVFALYSLLCRHANVGLLPNHQMEDDHLLTYEMENIPVKRVASKARRVIEKHKSTHYLMIFLAFLGSCMVIAIGVLLPAIYVYSSSSDLERALVNIVDQLFSSEPKLRSSWSHDFKLYVPIPSACAILIGLFALQRYGTHKIGIIFAPIISVWLLVIGLVGLHNIFRWDHKVFSALSPAAVYKFLKKREVHKWKSMGGVLLCISGSEAMFADLGHFSKKSIKIAFVFFVYPLLIMCYVGQTAFISGYHDKYNEILPHLSSSMPGSIRHIFPVLSLFATAVGSQAAITATFSIINQCLALGCFPRVQVIHTSNKIRGQVYIPDVNWIMLFLCLTVTIGLGNIRNIGNAVGFAIITAMLITTCLMSLIIVLYWEYSILVSISFLIFFASIEVAYLSACAVNIQMGAVFLIILVAILFTTMLSWHYGTLKKYEYDIQNRVSIDWLTELSPSLGVARVPGIGFIYTDIVRGIPAFFSHFVTNLPAFHQVLVFVSFKSLPISSVPPDRRYLIGRFGPREYNVYRCIVRYGYCDYACDTVDFEDQLLRRIGEFIAAENYNSEALTSLERRMIVSGDPEQRENALITQVNSRESCSWMSRSNANLKIELSEHQELQLARRKKVGFVLPPQSPRMLPSTRQELQDVIDARESGTAYFLGKSHLSVRKESNFLKKFLLRIYIFLDSNCREPSVALNIPLAALVEVGLVYSI